MTLSAAKRLAPFMEEAVEKLEAHREIDLTDKIREKLLKVSASTIDKLLKKEKDACRIGRGRSGTKPATLLKKSIPIRTFLRLGRCKARFCGGRSSGP